MVEVDYLVLADAVAAADGKHYIHGGGWDMISTASLPFQYALIAVAIRVRVPWAETNQPHEVVLDILDADGVSVLGSPSGPPHVIVNLGRPPNLPPGTDQTLPLVINLQGILFEKAGPYATVVTIDGADAARTAFSIMHRP